MKKGQKIRSLMLIAGMLAFVVTLLFQAPGEEQQKEDAKSETKDKSATAFVQAPVIAIPGTAIQLEDSVLPVLSVIALPESVKHFPTTVAIEITRYFSVLFRTLIAPNAP